MPHEGGFWLGGVQLLYKTTVDSLYSILHGFAPPQTIMSDNGSHFKNAEVRELCENWGISLQFTPAYSPWVNGLVEGTNKLLIYILARLCAPPLGEDNWQQQRWETLPRNWPDYFDKAIRILNWRKLPSLQYSPKELLMGLVVNTPKTALPDSLSQASATAAEVHMAYVAQQRLDALEEATKHTQQRKVAFDRKLLRSKAGLVTFKVGQLVQIHRADADNAISSQAKLTPQWSEPHVVVESSKNSCCLETLEGHRLESRFSYRRLRHFVPRPGTRLEEIQRDILRRTKEKENEQSPVSVSAAPVPSHSQVPNWRAFEEANPEDDDVQLEAQEVEEQEVEEEGLPEEWGDSQDMGED